MLQILLTFLFLGQITHANETVPTALQMTAACTTKEQWTLPPEVTPTIATEWKQFLSGSTFPLRGLTRAWMIQSETVDPVLSALAEYWMTRSLFQLGYIDLSQAAFASLVKKFTDPELRPFQQAAFECLSEIRSRHAHLSIPLALTEVQHLAHLSESVDRGLFWIGAARIGHGSDQASVQALIQKLKASPLQMQLQALLYLQQKQYNKAIPLLRSTIEQGKLLVPDLLNSFRLLLARSEFTIKDYGKAADTFRSIEKSSNELAQSLSELGWAFLKNDQLNEAIGTTIQLQSGHLRKTYAPESILVMAMAMNELCQYPEAIQGIQLFKKQYDKTYSWLAQWQNNSGTKPDLYQETIQYLKKTSQVPNAIGTEWIRNSVFLAGQDHINLLVRQRKLEEPIRQAAWQEQRKMAAQLKTDLQAIHKDWKLLQKQLKPGDAIPVAFEKRYDQLRADFELFSQYKKVAPKWKKAHERSVALTHKKEPLIKDEIRRSLTHLQQRMITQLNEVGDQMQLIEVEIYSEASKDIVWQNANPEYKKMARSLAANDSDKGEKSKPTWSWGKVSHDLSHDQEMWEDELGSFRADLVDNCSNRDRFMALMKAKR